MTTPNAFKAVYSDWKLIRTRKVVQIVFETPLEHSDVAYRVLGGMPDPGQSAWFGIAPLNETAKGGDAHASRDEHPRLDPAPRLQPPQAEGGARKSPAQVAGYLCTLPSFWKFLREACKRDVWNEEAAAKALRDMCFVDTRADIGLDDFSRTVWTNLRADFTAWEKEVEVVG